MIGLTRDAAHLYRWNGGPPQPGVTGITGMLDKSNVLVGWAKRETAACAVRNLDLLTRMVRDGGAQAAVQWLKAIPDYQRDTAADLGSRVHALAEATARGESVEVTDEEAPFLTQYRRFLDDWRPQYRALEAMVYSETHGYGGTLDAIARIGRETWLIDTKTSKGVYGETALQLIAYARADFIGKPADPRKYRVPRIDRYGVLHLRPDGYRVVEFHPTDDTWRAFLACRELLRWREGEGRVVMGKELEAAA